MEKKLIWSNGMWFVRKRQRGLGLRSLTLFNKALLGKWSWRFTTNSNCTWKKVIVSKFGVEDLGWWSKEARWPFGVNFWKDIPKESRWVKDNCDFRIGNGNRIRFWMDHCCGPSTLYISFPSLFDLSC